MKKALLLLAAFAAFVSCSKEASFTEDFQQEICNEIKFDFTVADLDPSTKAVKTSWTKGDILNIWMDGHYTTTPDLVLTYNGKTWDLEQKNTDLSPKSGNNIVAMYEGINRLKYYISSTDMFELNRGVGFKKRFSPRENGHDIYQYPMVASSLSTYEYSSNTIKADFSSWFFQTGVQVLIPGMDTTHSNYWTLSCPQMDVLLFFGISDNTRPIWNIEDWGWDYPVVSVVIDGVPAFYFARPHLSKPQDYTFCLKYYDGGTGMYNDTPSQVYYYTAKDKTLPQDNSKCQSIVIPFSKFTTATPGQ